MDAIRFYGVRRKLQRLQASTSNNKNDEEDLELLQSDSDTDTLESDYECRIMVRDMMHTQSHLLIIMFTNNFLF